MKYKAVIFDMDGTLLPVGSHDNVSPRVVEAVHKSHSVAKICAATGRSPLYALPVMKKIDITNLSVTSGGSMIIDPVHNEVVWEVKLEDDTVHAIVDIYRQYRTEKSTINFSGRATEHAAHEPDYEGSFHALVFHEMPQDKLDEIVIKLKKIPNVTAHPTPHWLSSTHNIDVTHKLGDKKHGVIKLLELLELKAEEVIGVGDSSNDVPLLEVAGLKVAMGNAPDFLKDMADYIAPSVEDDGAADVLEKFILK